MRILILIIICLTNFEVFAQDNQPIKRVSSGIKIGSEVGFMNLKQSAVEANTGLDIGYSITLDFIEYRVNNKFSANIGIGFSNRKYRQNIDNVVLPAIFVQAPEGREYLALQNVEVPITGKLYLGKQDKKTNRQHYIIGGTTVIYNLHNNSLQKLFFADGSTWEYNRENNIQRTTLSLTMGTGIEIDLKRELSYVLEPILQINPNQIDFSNGRDANALVAIGLMAGLKF